MGYDEYKPSTWTVRQLLDYCTQHALAVESGTEKRELIALVDDHLTHRLLQDEGKRRMALKDEELEDVVNTPVDTLLHHVAYPQYAEALRAHPAKLKALVDAGLEQLRSLKYIADLQDSGRHPPLQAWLNFVANGEDEGAALRAALTSNTAATAVCGRYFSSSEMVVRCLDCGADGTCVICMDCFRHSPCMSHRYRISPGSGGGMCDCGDPTAWKQESFCSRHRGHHAVDDPTASIPAEQRAWIDVVLGGTVQLVALLLQQAMRIEGRRRGERVGRKAQATTELEEAERVDAEAAARLDPELLTQYIYPAAMALVKLTEFGDCAKRVLATRWVELAAFPVDSGVPDNASDDAAVDSPDLPEDPLAEGAADTTASADSASAPRSTCLAAVFAYVVNHSKTKLKWQQPLMTSIANCLSDPRFRTSFAAVMATYAERASCSPQLRKLTVQVFTNPEVTELLLSPSELPYRDAHDTLLHRDLSSVLYLFCQCRDAAVSFADVPGCAWLISLRRDRVTDATALLNLGYALSTSRNAGLAMVTSRTLLRALTTVLQVLSVSGAVQKDETLVNTHAVHTALWFTGILTRQLWRLQGSVRDILRALLRRPGQPTAAQTGIPSAALLATLRNSKRLDSPPDRAARRRDHRRLVQHAALAPAEEALLLPEVVAAAVRSNAAEGLEDAFDYVTAVLREVLRAVAASLTVQHIKYCDGTSDVSLERAGCGCAAGTDHILRYDTLKAPGHAVSSILPQHRLFSAVVKAWVVECTAAGHGSTPSTLSERDYLEARLYGCTRDERLPQSAVDPASVPWLCVSSSDTHCPPHSLRRLLDAVFGPASERRPTVEPLLDSLVMPWVLLSQVERGLWRRNDQNVLELMASYTLANTKFDLEHDVWLLQVLTMLMPPQDYTLRLLQRFSYRAAGSRILGYPRLLRLILTIVHDTSKANVSSDLNEFAVTRTVANALARGRLLHSKVQDIVSSAFRGVEYDDDDEETEGEQSTSTMVHRALATLATAERTPRGKTFRLKDTATWRQHVDLYYPSSSDNHLEEMYSMYSGISSLERLAERAAHRANEEAEEDGGAPPAPVRIEPTTLRTEHSNPELLRYTRALLHTDGLLVPALYVVLQYVVNLQRKERGAESTSESRPSFFARLRGALRAHAGRDADGDDDDPDDAALDEAEKANLRYISEPLLLHAVTAIYLCSLDCAAISAAVRLERGLAAAEDHAATVDWELVQAYLEEQRIRTSSFTMASASLCFPLPELVSPATLQAKLTTPVGLQHFGCALGNSTQDTWTAADALIALRGFLRANTEVDQFSIATMIESVLTAAGLASFEPDGAPAAEVAKAAELQSRRQRVKEKQARLLQRMMARGARTVPSATAEAKGEDDEQRDHAKQAQACEPHRVDATGFLQTRLLMDLTALECCICKVGSSEPLMLLGHSSTSSVLPHLSSIALADGRRAHSHYCVCGHAAHKSCTQKLFSRLSQLWLRGSFQGEYALGPAEFTCPMCMLICTTLSPVPSLREVSSAPSSAPTLFEDIRWSTSHPADGSYEAAQKEALQDLRESIAQASVGLSSAEDGNALVEHEDELQQHNNAAWTVSETLRTIHYQLQLTLEAAKIGRRVRQVDVLAVFSLLVALDEDVLASVGTVVEANYARTGEDFCLLLLHVLRRPRDVVELLRTHTIALINTAGVRELVRNLLHGSDEQDESQPELLIALWKELGCLTILKTLLVEAPAGEVLREDREHVIEYTPLSEVALSSASQRRGATLAMWHYLTGLEPAGTDDIVTALDVQLNPPTANSSTAAERQPLAHRHTPLSVGPTALVNPTQWSQHLLTHVLHLPEEYTEVLTDYARARVCSECGKVSVRPVVCCLCNRHLCLQPHSSPPELYNHARTCSGGVGLFLMIYMTSFVVCDTVGGRIAPYASVYADEFGEADEGLRRGGRLGRDDEEGVRLLWTWIANRWGVESRVIKAAWRANMRAL